MQFCNNNCKPQTCTLPIKNAFIGEFTKVQVCWRCSKASLWSSSWTWGPSFGCFYAKTMCIWTLRIMWELALPMNSFLMVSIPKIVLLKKTLNRRGFSLRSPTVLPFPRSVPRPRPPPPLTKAKSRALELAFKGACMNEASCAATTVVKRADESRSRTCVSWWEGPKKEYSLEDEEDDDEEEEEEEEEEKWVLCSVASQSVLCTFISPRRRPKK